PANATAPTISGTAQEKQTLTADPGSWSGTQPISYAYQWRRCDTNGANCADIIPAATATYTLTAADVDSTVRVSVPASNIAGPASADSAPPPLLAALPIAPANATAPTITGPAQANQTLTADPGSWSGTQPISYAYQWRRCDTNGANCADIAGAATQ